MSLNIEVAYATPEQQIIIPLALPDQATVETAIINSGVLQRFPEIDLQQNAVGIFGKTCALNQTLRAGDRIEIYRPLLIDPKEARKKRAIKS